MKEICKMNTSTATINVFEWQACMNSFSQFETITLINYENARTVLASADI